LLRHVPVHRKVDRNVIRLTLKVKIIEQHNVIDLEMGTLQSGVLSPILANVVLMD